MPTCRKCGANEWEVTRGPGALETWKCKRCGTEETAHVNYANRMPPRGAGETWFSLDIDLPSSLTTDQIQALRRLFRQLESMSPVAIKKAAMSRETIALGKYPQSEADALTREVEALGLSLGREPVASP